MNKNKSWSDLGQKHQSLNDTIYIALRQAIFRGDYKPGERLTEPGLAKLFGVSRNPIREVLRKLQSEGIVEISPRKSARVALFTSEEIEEIIELRAELEGMSAKFATNRLNSETTKLFKKLLDDGNKAADAKNENKVKNCNQKYHSLLASSGKNRYLADYVLNLRERTLWLFEEITGGRHFESWREHAGVIEAILAEKGKEAAKLAEDHVKKVGEEVLKVRSF